jgi:hypothetical protein
MLKRHFLPLFDRMAELHRNHPKENKPATKRFNWHALRHFAISSWIDAGLPPKTRLGYVKSSANWGSPVVLQFRA